MNITKQKILVFSIAILFLLLPFFWFKPGEMDLGGDGTRLYFYDPLAYLQNYALYGVSPSGFGGENMGYFMVPFVIMLAGLKLIFSSPTILIAFFHGVSLAVAFLACYGILKNLLDISSSQRSNINSIAAIVASIAYIFSPAIYGWDKVIVTHNQFFLNPLMFLLLLRYVVTSNVLYLLFSLVITFIFAPNFSFAAAPAFFAFYPLSLLFLLLIQLIVLKKRIIWRHAILCFSLFALLQLFHIIPQIMSMLSVGSVLNATIFSDEGKFNRGLSYFIAIAPNIKVSLNVLNLPEMTPLNYSQYFSFLFPLIITLGMLWNKGKLLLLVSVFFLITLFFASANITNVGFILYKKLFDIPGFSMFRNFYGQWGYAMLFYLVILFGQSLGLVLTVVRGKYLKFVPALIVIVLVITAIPFINGSFVNKDLWLSKTKKIFMTMDPNYEEAVRFIRSLPVEGKVLTFPLSDPGYQIIAGINDGAYQGPSTISYLGGKQDFAGFEEFGQFKELFKELIKNKDYAKVKELLGFLNIKYVFYNSDPAIYDNTFPEFPYSESRKFLPVNQAGYKRLIKELNFKKVKSINNKYFIYEIDNKFYNPRFFATPNADYYENIQSNISLPFSFGSTENKKIYFNSSQVPSTPSNHFIYIENNTLSKIAKNSEFFIHPQDYFSRFFPGSVSYPLTVIKEYMMLRKQNESFLYISNRMSFASRRLYELELLEKDTPIFITDKSKEDILKEINSLDKERTLSWELEHMRNNWESELIRYFRNFKESVAYLKNSKEDVESKMQKKLLIYEYILDHKIRLSITTGRLPKDKESSKLEAIIDTMFENILQELDLPDIGLRTPQYISPSIKAREGSVELYVKKDGYENFLRGNYALLLNSQELSLSQYQPEKGWLKLDSKDFELNKGVKINVIVKDPVELMKTAKFISLENFDQRTNFAQQNKDRLDVKWRNGLVWEIKNWRPRSYYVLSFEYLTKSGISSVRFYQKIEKKNEKNSEIELAFQNSLKSNKWTKYQAVVQASNDANAAFLQIIDNDTLTPIAPSGLRNISLKYLPNPEIMLKVKEHESRNVMPKISFIKINPTKYKVNIRQAESPFYLVLNQGYNSRWELFPSTSQSGSISTTESKQGNFIDWHFFETFQKKSIEEKNHYEVNSYANAWYIDPKALGNKKEYSFIVEMTTQRYFYIGMIISLIAFVGVITYLGYRLIRYKK